MPTLKSFHGVLGNDSLKELDAVIYANKNYMLVRDKSKIHLKQLISKTVNSIILQDKHTNIEQKDNINALVTNLFSEPDGKWTYTTKVIGEIRTTNDSPVYTKYYPYPASLKREVENQVQKLLKDVQIQISIQFSRMDRRQKTGLPRK